MSETNEKPFAVGDIVKIVKAEFEIEQPFVGRCGKIVSVGEEDCLYGVRFPEGREWAFFANELVVADGPQ